MSKNAMHFLQYIQYLFDKNQFNYKNMQLCKLSHTETNKASPTNYFQHFNEIHK